MKVPQVYYSNHTYIFGIKVPRGPLIMKDLYSNFETNFVKPDKFEKVKHRIQVLLSLQDSRDMETVIIQIPRERTKEQGSF